MKLRINPFVIDLIKFADGSVLFRDSQKKFFFFGLTNFLVYISFFFFFFFYFGDNSSRINLYIVQIKLSWIIPRIKIN